MGHQLLYSLPPMKRRLLFVVNPIAGTRKKGQLEGQLQEEAEKDGWEYRIFHSARSTNAYALQHIAEEFDATDIIACGGDGTVNMVAAAVRNSHIRVGIIPVGSGNGLARAAQIPLQVAQAYDVIRRAKTVHADGFSVNRHFAVMLAGIGFDAAVAESFAASTRRGLVTYTTHTLLQYFKAHPYSFEVCLDDFSFFTDAFFISVANSNQFGNNVTIAPLASITDGLLDIVIVQKMPKAELPFALLRQIRGANALHPLAQEVRKKHVLYYQAKSIQIRNLQLAPMHIDGDPAKSEAEIEVQILPQSFWLMVP